MTLLVAGDNVTVPVPWSTRPAEVVPMLSMNCGSWKSTGPAGGCRERERYRLAFRRDLEAQPPAIGGREVRHRDGPVIAEPLGGDPPAHDEGAVGTHGDQRGEKHAVGL